MSNIYFLGILYNPDDEETILSNSIINPSNSPNVFQLSILDGIINNGAEKHFKLVNVLPVGVCPYQYKKLFLKSKHWNYNGIESDEIGTINLHFIKQSIRTKRIKKYLKANVSDGDHIVVYSCYLPFLKAIKDINKNVSVSLIITDMPEFYDYTNVSKLWTYFRKRNNKKIYKSIKRIDSFVFLTSQMSDKFDSKKPYIVVEGISNFPTSFKLNKSKKKVIFYSGTLNYKYDIMNLLDAFEKLSDKTAELWLCGSGDAEAEIINRSKINKRIKYYGFCSKSKLYSLMEKASVLVNPRQNADEYTKYSFPAKTMEYMASGIPVVLYKLDGIPNEYYDYAFCVEDNTIEALVEKIEYVLSLDKYASDSFGRKAKSFINTQKNCTMQSKKILDFIFGNKPYC